MIAVLPVAFETAPVVDEAPVTETLIQRVANVPLGASDEDLAAKLIAEGVSPDNVFLAVMAGRILRGG